MSKYLVIDTETSGLFDFSKPADAEGQPRMASIAMILLDENLGVEEESEFFISPEGWELDPESDAAKVNGLTMDFLLRNGQPIKGVLELYSQTILDGRVVVAYGAQYDTKIVRAELRRASMPDLFTVTPNICVMKAMGPICNIPRAKGAGWKTPKLIEAYRSQFGRSFEGVHGALSDAQATAALFKRMAELGPLPEATVHYAKNRPEAA